MLAAEAEEAAHYGNMQDLDLDLYATIKKLSEKYSKPETQVKHKDGRSISDEEGQRKRWVEHFEQLLN